jgi:hypothetical protein
MYKTPETKTWQFNHTLKDNNSEACGMVLIQN